MIDCNRTLNQPTRGQQPSSHDPARRDEDGSDMEGTSATKRAPGDRASVADDRGMHRERRSFNGDREHDELGSEMEDDLAVDESYDELGGSGQSER